MMVSVKNERGEEVTRQVVGVGALQPGEGRTFTFAVEVFTNEATGVKPEGSEERSSLPSRLAQPSQPAPPSAAAKREALKGVNRS